MPSTGAGGEEERDTGGAEETEPGTPAAGTESTERGGPGMPGGEMPGAEMPGAEMPGAPGETQAGQEPGAEGTTGVAGMEACHDAQMFRMQVDQFATADNPAHPEAVEALRTLADALGAMPGNLETQANTIRDRAGRVEASGPKSTQHADWTREALMTALTAMEPMSASRPDLAQPLAEARRAVEAIQTNVAWSQQQPAMTDAFKQVAHVVEMASMPAGMGMCPS
jgi:hypothetical protein